LKSDKRPEVRGNVCSYEKSNQPPPVRRKKPNATAQKQKVDRPNKGQKKKEIRKQRALERLKAKGVDLEEYKRERVNKELARQRTLESYLYPWDESFAHKLEIRTVRVGSLEFNQSVEESYLVYKKYQETVHHDKRVR
jgi:arginine-tRNA-protein transferase